MGTIIGPVDDRETRNEWRSSRLAAWFVTASVVVAPLAVAVLAVQVVTPWLLRPDGVVGAGLFIAQAAAIGVVVAGLVERQSRRLLPLASLFRLSLVFPDVSPSRFGLVLRTLTVRRRTRTVREATSRGLAGGAREASHRAVELVAALHHHDRTSRGHSERVMRYADRIAEELGVSHSDRTKLAWGALLHDVGTLATPPEVLRRAAATGDESLLDEHVRVGREMLEPLEWWLGDWRLAAGQHRERWDGRGRPGRLGGTDISLAGRIVAVADAFDRVATAELARGGSWLERARLELVTGAGTRFDPEVVRAMLNAALPRRRNLGGLAWVGVPSVWSGTPGSIATLGSTAATSLVAVAIGVGSAVAAIDDPARSTAAAATTTGSRPNTWDDPLAGPTVDGPADRPDASVPDRPVDTRDALVDAPRRASAPPGVDLATGATFGESVVVSDAGATGTNPAADELVEPVTAAPTGGTGGGSGDEAGVESLPIADPVGEIVGGAVDGGADASAPVVEAVEDLVDDLLEPVVDDLIDSVVDEVIEPVVDEVIEPVVDEVIEPVVDEVIEPVVDEVIEPVVDEVIEPVVDEVIEPVVDEVIDLVDDVGSVAGDDGAADGGLGDLVDDLTEGLGGGGSRGGRGGLFGSG